MDGIKLIGLSIVLASGQLLWMYPKYAREAGLPIGSWTAILSSIGKVSVRYGQLDYALKLYVKALAEVSQREALDATNRVAIGEIRERVRKLAKQRLGEGTELVRLDALFTRVGRCSDRRNELLHGLWAQELDGEPYIYLDGARTAQPTQEHLNALADEMAAISNELHDARLNGWLMAALSKRPTAPAKDTIPIPSV